MNNQQGHPTGETGRHSHRPQPGIASDYRVHQSDEDTTPGNLKTVAVIGVVVAGAAALVIGFIGRKLAKSMAVGAAQGAADKITTQLHEDQILARRPESPKDPARAAKLVKLADREASILVFKVEKKKGERPRITHRQRGRLVIGDTANNVYVFAVSGPEPLVFTLHDVRNLFTSLSGPCLVVGEA